MCATADLIQVSDALKAPKWGKNKHFSNQTGENCATKYRLPNKPVSVKNKIIVKLVSKHQNLPLQNGVLAKKTDS